MTYCENAALIDTIEELKQIVNEQFSNPTIDRLMFLETIGTEDKEGKLFPCYIESYTEEKGTDGETLLSLQCVILQSSGQEFGMVRVNIPQEQINSAKRFWDKPPKKAVRDETPWAIGGEVLQ